MVSAWESLRRHLAGRVVRQRQQPDCTTASEQIGATGEQGEADACSASQQPLCEMARRITYVPAATIDTMIQRDDGEGESFVFELAYEDRAGMFLQSGPTRWMYCFSNLGVAYTFDVARARRWLLDHLADATVVTFTDPVGERHVVAVIPYERFLQEIACGVRHCE